MTKKTHSFEVWFETLCMLLGDEHGVNFRDQDAVREDYDNGRDLYDVKDEIAAEYSA